MKMKKILLATTVLAFAGSAFAATVSGSVSTEYYSAKNGEDKQFKSKGSVTFSGSKTSSNGLTFGGSYKVSIDRADSAADSYTRNPNTVSVSNTAGGVSDVSTGDGAFSAGEETDSKVSAFVSGSFGRVDLGKHGSAGKLGGIGGDVTDAITYTTPTFSGFSGKYTYGATAKQTRGFGVKYAGNFSGASLSAGYGSEQKDGAKTTGWELKAGMMGVTVEYETDTTTGNSDADKNAKGNEWSIKYAASNWDVKYGVKTFNVAKDKKTTIAANYTVAEGLKVYIKDEKDTSKDSGEQKKTYIGTTISF